MKVISFSRKFPKEHPKEGQPTHFVEKVWNSFRGDDYALPDIFKQWTTQFPFTSEEYLQAIHKEAIRECKYHTIRTGNRWKVGDMASLRVWSGYPYRSKQVEFAQVEVKKIWQFEISHGNYSIDTIQQGSFIPNVDLLKLANNDGLYVDDFWSWFNIHPKKNENVFRGQIICWNDKIEY